MNRNNLRIFEHYSDGFTFESINNVRKNLHEKLASLFFNYNHKDQNSVRKLLYNNCTH